MDNKILFVCNVPPPYQGTTIMNSYLIDYFSSQKLPYLHLAVEASKNHKELGKLNFDKVKNAFGVLAGILKERKKYSIAYLIMSVEGFAFYRHVGFVLLILLLKKKVILHLRGVGFDRKTGFQQKLTGFIFKRSYLIQHSERNRFDIKKYQYKQVFDVPNGWPDSYNGFKENRAKNKTTIDFVFLSNLIESKGVITVLESIALIKGKLKGCKFHFVGNWKENATREKFERYIEQYDLSAFIGYIGPKYNDEKYAFLANMDVLLFPTYYEFETWGNVNMEAMMFKIPVIATNIVGIPDMIKDDENGFLIEPKQPHELANRILRLIESPELRSQFGEKGRGLFLEKFTLDKFEKNMLKVFQEVDKA